MSAPDPNTITAHAQNGLRRNAVITAGGVAGASIVALLAVASVAGPVLASGVTVATVAGWLGGLGGNALAAWLVEWAQRNLARFEGQDPDQESRLIARMAQDLTAELGRSQAVADAVGLVLSQTDAVRVTLDALKGQSDRQARLLQLLLEDVQSARVENGRLHGATFDAVRQQAQAVLDAQTQGHATLAAQLRELLAAVQRAEAAASKPAPPAGGISIGGGVGTFQQINVSGGSVGSIIGKQVTYHGASPAGSAAPSQEEIDEARELLSLQRQNLAAYTRLATRGQAAAAHQAAQAREEIRRLKAQLRAWGQAVTDEPGDEG